MQQDVMNDMPLALGATDRAMRPARMITVSMQGGSWTSQPAALPQAAPACTPAASLATCFS